MAKRKTTTSEVVTKQETILISVETTDPEILRYDQEGKLFEFSGGGLRILPDAVVQALSHENAKRYWVAYGHEEARRGKEKPKPFLQEIIDPLVGHEEARLHYESNGTSEGNEFLKRYHLSWQYHTTVDGFLKIGYERVTEKDPVQVGIPANPSGYYLTRDTKGQDELLLLKVPMHVFKAHEAAVVAKSQAAISGATREKFAEDLERATKGRAKPASPESFSSEIEKVTLGPAGIRPTSRK